MSTDTSQFLPNVFTQGVGDFNMLTVDSYLHYRKCPLWVESECSTSSSRRRDVHVSAVFYNGTTRDSNPLAVQYLADCMVAEGLLGGVRILSFSACKVTPWARNNLDTNQYRFVAKKREIDVRC
jgi:hypothetical protein